MNHWVDCLHQQSAGGLKPVLNPFQHFTTDTELRWLSCQDVQTEMTAIKGFKIRVISDISRQIGLTF
jgi:hypothetical protein